MEEKKKVCSVCGNPNKCNPTGNCWCSSYPPIFQPSVEKTCLCESCLKKAIKKEIDLFMTDLTPEKIKQAQALKPVEVPSEGIDYYIDKQGQFVFTGWYLLRRGYCCKKKCLNCPYNE